MQDGHPECNVPRPCASSMPSKKTCCALSGLLPTAIASYKGRKPGSMRSDAWSPFGAKPMPALQQRTLAVVSHPGPARMQSRELY